LENPVVVVTYNQRLSRDSELLARCRKNATSWSNFANSPCR